MVATLLGIIFVGVLLLVAGVVFRVLGKIVGWVIWFICVGAVALLFVYLVF